MILLGLRAAARELGISHPALLKHEKRGRVKHRNADGLFDVDDCRRSLAENSRPVARRSQQHAERAAVPTRPAPAPVVAIRPPTLAARVDEDESTEQGALSLPAGSDAADVSLTAIQRQRELLKLERERIGFLEFKGTLVDAANVKTAVTARAAEEREALLNWPSRISAELAAELNVDERTLYAALEKQVRTFLRERSRVVAPGVLGGAVDG